MLSEKLWVETSKETRNKERPRSFQAKWESGNSGQWLQEISKLELEYVQTHLVSFQSYITNRPMDSKEGSFDLVFLVIHGYHNADH